MNNNLMKKLVIYQKNILPAYYQFNQYNKSAHDLIKEFESYKKGNHIQEPYLDLENILSKENRDLVEKNIKLRKTQVNLNEIYSLFDKYNVTKDQSLRKQLVEKAVHIPNTTHYTAPQHENFEIIKTINERKTFDFKPKSFLTLMNKHGYCRTDQITQYLGNRSYYFSADLCLLENSLIQYVLAKLKALDFQLITVPDILPEDVIKRCGMPTKGKEYFEKYYT